MIKRYKLPIAVFLMVFFLLTMVQLKVKVPMLLFERLLNGGGWLEILIVALFGAFVVEKMSDPLQSARWRRISWSVFSIWFFLQLALGLGVSSVFLLTGKLHLPIPAMMIAGPIYRGEKSVMTILFLSTIVLTGPAWCSQLCYFGAIDSAFSKGKRSRQPIKGKMVYKNSILLLVIMGAILFRLFEASYIWAAVGGLTFGIVGLLVIVILSRKQHRMVHCSVYCPIGTVVNYMKFINPFRMVIDSNCDLCLACSPKCKYDALNLNDLKNKKPGITCALCGDCVSSCKSGSIHYKFLKMEPEKARNLYLFLTITVYSVFLAMGRL